MMEQHNTDIIFYSSPEGNIRVEVGYEYENFWVTQTRMAELFGVEVNTTTIWKNSSKSVNYRKIEFFEKFE